MNQIARSPLLGFSLSIVSGKGLGREFSFGQASVIIGRAAETDLVLHDTGVSRNHCQITHEAGAFVLRDIGSANGTFLNDALTTEAYLRSGDRIGIGPVTFEFNPDQEGQALPAQPRLAWDASQTIQRRVIEEAETQAGEAKLGRIPRTPKPAVLRRIASRLDRRVAWLALCGLVIGATVFAIRGDWFFERVLVDRSREIFLLNETNADLRFGAGKVDVYTPRSATFAFDYTGGSARLTYAAGGIDSDDEVSIWLNGRSVGHAPSSPQRWTTGHSVQLPRELLYRGRNLVAFKHHPLQGTEVRWGIARVAVEERSLPPIDAERSQELLELGKTTFATRTVAPQNLARAIEYFEQALLLLEGADERPPLYYDISKRLRAAKQELQNVFESHIFASEQASRFGDRALAVDTLTELLQYVPDPDDRRHVEAKSRLTKLRGTR